MVPLPLTVWEEVPPPSVVVPWASFNVDPVLPEVPTSSFVTPFRADVPPSVTVEELPIDKSGVDRLAEAPRVRLPAPMLTDEEVDNVPLTVSVPDETATVPPVRLFAVVEPVTLKVAAVPPSRLPTFPPFKVFSTLVELPVETKSNFVVIVGEMYVLVPKLKLKYDNEPEPNRLPLVRLKVSRA